MNGLQLFQKEGWRVRTLVRDGEPWFVASDVCKALEIANGPDAVGRLDLDEKMTVDSTDSHSGQRGGAQSFTIISEPGLYALVLGSRKKEAKVFKRWVTHEVIPSIRRYGVYATSIPKTMAESLRMYAASLDQIEAQNRLIEQQAPMVAAAEKIASAENTMTIKDFAKSLDMGPIRIFGRLSRLGIIYRNSDMDWVPFQRFIDRGYFTTKVTPIPHGEKIVNHTTALITGKGEVWLAAKLSGAERETREDFGPLLSQEEVQAELSKLTIRPEPRRQLIKTGAR